MEIDYSETKQIALKHTRSTFLTTPSTALFIILLDSVMASIWPTILARRPSASAGGGDALRGLDRLDGRTIVWVEGDAIRPPPGFAPPCALCAQDSFAKAVGHERRGLREQRGGPREVGGNVAPSELLAYGRGTRQSGQSCDHVRGFSPSASGHNRLSGVGWVGDQA